MPGAKATVKESASTAQNPSGRILIRPRNIRRSQLTTNAVSGQPVDELNEVVPMNARGLIKVFLHLETTGLKGYILFQN